MMRAKNNIKKPSQQIIIIESKRIERHGADAPKIPYNLN